MSDLRSVIIDFTDKLTQIIEAHAIERAQELAVAALGGNVRRGPGRPPKALLPAVGGGKPRKKPPIQYCPVPGCKNRAAPVFGMVCADHKGLPKKKIAAYREARRAKKSGAKPTKAAKVKAKAKAKPKAKPAKRKVSRKPRKAPAGASSSSSTPTAAAGA